MAEGTVAEISESPITSAKKIATIEEPSAIEKVDQGEKEALVRKIGAFYELPEQVISRGLASEMSILPEVEFNRQLEEYLIQRSNKRDTRIEEELKRRDVQVSKIVNDIDAINNEYSFRAAIQEEAKITGGVNIPIDELKSQILIKEGADLDKKMIGVHEMVHAMGSRGPENGGGFHDKDGGARNLNEATTQVLTLGILYPNLSPFEMYQKILTGEIKTCYGKYVVKLLTALYTTSQSSEPITIKDLAKYYFHAEGDTQGVLLQMKIIDKAPEAVKGPVSDLLANDLQGKRS